MCLIGAALLAATGPATRPGPLRPRGENLDRNIADNEELDRTTRVNARTRLGIPAPEANEDGSFAPLAPTTEEELKAGRQTLFDNKPGPLKPFDPDVLDARADATERLFPSSKPRLPLGIPGFSGRPIPQFGGGPKGAGSLTKRSRSRRRGANPGAGSSLGRSPSILGAKVP